MKRKLAMLLALTLGMSLNVTNVFATTTDFTSGGGAATVVTGGSVVVEPVYKVVLPTKLNVTLDPLERTTTPYYSGSAYNVGWGFPVINKSNVDIKLSVNLLTVVSDGATTVISDGALAALPSTDTAKKFYMYAVPFKTVTGITTTSYAATKATYATALDSQVFLDKAADETTVTSAGATLEFRLKAAAYEYGIDNATNAVVTTAGAIDAAAGVAGFTVRGKMNPQADWESGDITLAAAYSMVGVTPAVYSGITLKTDGMNLMTAKHSPVANSLLTNPGKPVLITKLTTTGTTKSAGVFGIDNAMGLTIVGYKLTNTTNNKVLVDGKLAAPLTQAVSGSGLKITVANTAAIGEGEKFQLEVQYSNGVWEKSLEGTEGADI